MYFASESCNTTAVCSALMTKIVQHPSLNWLALVDGAFDYGLKGLALSNKRYALYDYEGMSDLLPASPFLILLTTNDQVHLASELTVLIRHRRERPMLSFIASKNSAFSVNEHLQRYANVLTEDDQEFLLRFADTRVLLGLPTALRPESWNGMIYEVCQWIVIDREGQLHELPVEKGNEPPNSSFKLSACELATLLSNNEPDAVIDTIAERNPEALSETNGANIYNKVAHACDFAKKHNVTAFPDLVALSYLGLLDEGAALKNPTLSEMLSRKHWHRGSLIDDLDQFVA